MREHVVDEVEPGLHVARTEAPAGLQGGQPAQCRRGDFRPGAIGVRGTRRRCPRTRRDSSEATVLVVGEEPILRWLGLLRLTLRYWWYLIPTLWRNRRYAGQG